MNIVPVHAFTDNYIWMLVDKKRATAMCVDPGDSRPVLVFLQQHQLKLTHVLLTHHHDDHIGGVGDLVAQFPNVQVLGPNDNRITKLTHPVTRNEKVNLDSLQFTVLSIPGHTSSHICYYEAQKGWLFCGDTLFSAGCGRVFDGTMSQLHDSLMLLKALPGSTQVYCGHEYTANNLRFAAVIEPDNQAVKEYLAKLLNQPGHCSLPSTMELEKQINPFLRTDSPSVQHYVLSHGGNTKSSLEVFTKLREDKNLFR